MSGYDEHWTSNPEPGFQGHGPDCVLMRPGARGTVNAWLGILDQDGTHTGTEFDLSTSETGELVGRAFRVENGVRVREVPCAVEPGETDDTYWLRLVEEG